MTLEIKGLDDAKKPPGHVATGEKVAGGVLFGLSAGPNSHPQRQGEIRRNQGPIQRGQLHENKDTSGTCGPATSLTRSSEQSEQIEHIGHGDKAVSIDIA